MTRLQQRILAFFILTYALTWFGWLGNWFMPGGPWPLPMNPFGPLIAAAIIIGLTEGRAGLRAWLRRITCFKAPVWTYAVALLVPVAIIVASIWLATASGAPSQPLVLPEILELLILVPIILIAGPAPEELSFRGYAQYELQQDMSPLTAALWVGAGVLIWHLPVFLTGDVPWPFIATIVAVSVVYAWLYQMGGSLWPLVTLHFSVNYFGGELLGGSIAPEGQVTYALYFAAFYLAWTAWIISRYGRNLGGKPG